MTVTTLALMCLLAGPAPLTISGDGWAVAPVTVNDRGPYLMIVDTAAGASAIYPALLQELNIDPKGGTRVEVQGASGRRTVPMHRIDKVAAAGKEVAGLSAVVLESDHLLNADQGKVRGVLGADFLKRFDVTMDFAGAEMILATPRKNAAPKAVHFNPLYGTFLLVPAKLEGREITVVIDTGARRSLMNLRAAEKVGLKPGDARLVRDEPVRGATRDTTEAWSYHPKELSAGGARWKEPLIGVSDLPVFHALGLGDTPAMIMGVNLLEDRSLRIDYDEMRLLISEPHRSQVHAPGP
jgi:predicted aspartyl protease